MRKHLTKIFAVAAMMVMSLTAFADTAIVSWQMGENGANATGANSITGASGCAAEGFTIAITGNTGKNWSNGNGSLTIGGQTYTTLKNSNGAQNTVTLPEGCAAMHVTFYVTTNDDNVAGNLYEFNGATVNIPVSSLKDYENPTVIEQDLDYATSFTFTFNTKQVCFAAVVDYRVAEVDPADVYVFGLTSELSENTIGSVETRASGCSHVETSALQATYQTLNNRTLYHGSTDAFTAPVAHRNMNLDNVLIKTQNGEDDGAENHDACMAFTLNIEEDYSLNLREIASDLYVEAKSNWYYEYVIEKGGVELYKSPVQRIAAGQSGSDHSNSITTLRWMANLQGLTGQVTVKLIWWINSGGTTLALKDFNVTGALKVSDNPHVEFGMGREFADATTFETGVEKLIGSPEHVTVALHNGAGLTYQNTDCSVKHGTNDVFTVPTGYRNYCNVHKEAANAAFENDLYWGFSVDIPAGYKMSISQLYGDMYAEKNQIQYKMGVYSSDAVDAEPLFMSDVKQGNITNMGAANVPMTVDTREVSALQNLKGKIYLRFYWNIASTAANAALKDFKIRALIETSPGEGINTLSFVEFTPAAHPEFTNGDVTAVFSNSANNVSPASNDRGIRMQGTYNYQMKLSVPEDAYISEVVFVWNNNGNPGENGNCMNLTVTNDVNQVVGTLTDKKVSNEKTWTCGDVRESELTFAQGDGDFYLNSIRVTYLKKEADPDKSYNRTHTHMNLNTLCFPYTVTSYTGGTFYTMLYKRVESSVPVEVVLEEHEGNLVAGTPYFYMPEGSQLALTYSGARENTPSKVNGVQGIYDQYIVPTGSFVAYNGEIRAVGNNVTLKEYRAYIIMDEVDEESAASAPAPGKKLLRIRNADAPAIITDIENVSATLGESQKILRNGQLFIIRDGKTYNAQGQMVK